MKNITLEREQKYFVSESLTPMSESNALNCRKLKVKTSFTHVTAEMELWILKWLIKADLLNISYGEATKLFFRTLILGLEKCTWMHLRILIPLYIQPTDFKCSSVKWIISSLGVNIVWKHVTLLFWCCQLN